jgi:hypothetical protein
MRLIIICLLLMSPALFAQPLTLTIETVSSKEDNDKERIFTVKYNLKNNTSDTLYFFYHPQNVSPSTGGSLTKEIYYKIYENDKFIEIGQAFNQFFRQKIDNELEVATTSAQRDSIIIVFLAKKLKEKPAKLFQIYNEEGLAGVVDPAKDYMQKASKRMKNYYHTLQPNQTENFEVTFNWNKNRYYYLEPNEYYLDENAKHYFELTFVALKEEFESKVDEEIFEKIMKLPNFIKGVFISNKVEINLKPD